jgi:uncharacterized protein YqeY
VSLKSQITEDMKAAMRARESLRLGAIRLLLAAIKQREVDERIELTDADVLSIVEKEIKKRRESITQYKAAQRQDLVDTETAELDVLSAYLPQALSDDELAREIAAAVAESGAAGPADIGKVMGLLKKRVAGRADMGKVSALVRSRLANPG